MNERRISHRPTAVERRKASTDRIVGQPLPPAAGEPGKSGSRHGAITDNLPTWRSYKAWIESMRNTWKEPKE